LNRTWLSSSLFSKQPRAAAILASRAAQLARSLSPHPPKPFALRLRCNASH
jgi:hypothetical protein